MAKTNGNVSELILGWKTNPNYAPQYWLDPKAKAGSQSEEELFKVSADNIGAHTAIIAQSGSGKSFFLGRFIEEIALRTQARCIILDPNADFRRIKDIEDSQLWENASYDSRKRRGLLPHEASREEFEEQWSNVRIKIATGLSGRRQGKEYEQFRLRWTALSVAFLAEDLEPTLRSELYHCHAFVQALEPLINLKASTTKSRTNLIDEAERLFKLGRSQAEEHFRYTLGQELSVGRLIQENKMQKQEARSDALVFIPFAYPAAVFRRFKKLAIEGAIERAIKAPKYVSESVERFYFGKAREYQASGILQTSSKESRTNAPNPVRLEVIDLPSLRDRSTRLIAINSLLTTEWERARASWSEALEQPKEQDERVPTFIIVDEAHNLIPVEPRGKAEWALREQFRTLVAEGRKYGLFLILVSQRPDKLDSLVLSECENKAIMKIGSASVLEITRKMLGLEDVPEKVLNKCLEFEIGRALMVGRWTNERPEIIYSAARRTLEGGRNLRASHWAVDHESKGDTDGDPTKKGKEARHSSKNIRKVIKVE